MWWGCLCLKRKMAKREMVNSGKVAGQRHCFRSGDEDDEGDDDEDDEGRGE